MKWIDSEGHLNQSWGYFVSSLDSKIKANFRTWNSLITPQPNKYAEILMTDTGKGLAKNQFKAIFSPGYTTKERGWGLGLSLVQRIVKDYHRGKIMVQSSEIGVGTTFKILLPKNS